MTKLNEITMPYKKRKENYQPNALTKSKQQFTLQEQKIVAFVINQIDHEASFEPRQNLVFEIPLAEIAEHMEHKYIKNAAISLTSKKIMSENGEDFGIVVPFPEVEYSSKKNTLKAVMYSGIVPYFTELGKEYTKYNLETILSFNSVYSQRFYQILRMYEGRKEKVFKLKVSDFQSKLNCDYVNFYDLKRRVLEPMKKEIGEKSDIFFTYSVSKKEGKRAVELEFTIKTPINIAIEEVKESVSKKSIYDEQMKIYDSLSIGQQQAFTEGELTHFKFTPKQVMEIIQDNTTRRNFCELNFKIKHGLISVKTTPTRYISAVLFNKK